MLNELKIKYVSKSVAKLNKVQFTLLLKYFIHEHFPVSFAQLEDAESLLTDDVLFNELSGTDAAY